MRAYLSARWKDRLPSAALALAVQAAFLALLVFSFTAVTRAPAPEAEVIFLLSRARPAPTEPVVIDARPRDAGGGATSDAPFVPPPYMSSTFALQATTPSGALVQPGAPGRGLDCRPDADGKRAPHCDPKIAPPPDPRALALNPPNHVQNEARWAGEKARADAPFMIPGGSPLGILITALTNPSAFADKRNWSYSGAVERKIDGYERKEQILRQLPPCPPGMGTDFERRACGGDSAGAVK